MKHKTLDQLTLKDNFLFGAVMSHEKNCKPFLELSLGFPIEHIEINTEKNIVFHPEYKGIRLNVFAKDENHTHYDVEMQVARKPDLGKRSRYYHSQIDMELLRTGIGYSRLPDSYVIFLCDFDPFGYGKYCYTFRNYCPEDGNFALRDGQCTVFLNTRGTNDEEVSPELVKFLNFVKAGLKESTGDFNDAFVASLQQSIREIKASRSMEDKYMLFEELLQEERMEGKKEYILDLLEELGSIPETFHEKLLDIQDESILLQLFKAAAKAESSEAFYKQAETLMS